MGQTTASNERAHLAPHISKPVLGEFYPLDTLWLDGTAPLFRSEQSARWFLRGNRNELVEGRAIAIHAGRMLVHPQRFSEVAQAIAFRVAAGALPGGRVIA